MNAAVPATAGDPSERVFRVRPSRRVFSLDLRELWQFHELLYFLVWRDVKVRYKQTVLGILWAVIQPVGGMVIFSIIFGRLAHIPSEKGVPYPLFVFAGLLPWNYFLACLNGSGMSIAGNSNLVTKVYFPRLIIPLGSVVTPLIDLAIASGVLACLFAYYTYAPSWQLVLAPLFVVLALLTAFGAGLWLAALNVRYRDIPYVIPFLAQIWFYVTPVIYPVSLVPARFQWLLALNPMAGVVGGFRWAVLGTGTPHYGAFAVSAVAGLILATSGLWYFRRFERTFADLI